MAEQNDHIYSISFDFEQNLPLPHIAVGDICYMQQLWVYVFGVHSCGNNQASMYCWPGSTAKRGSDEVISCLDHFLSAVPRNVTTLYLYSDGCGGQNNNSNVMRYLFTLVSIGQYQCIRHIFPVTAHSYLPNYSRDFGRTELSKRKNEGVHSSTLDEHHLKGQSMQPFRAVECSQSDYDRHFSSIFKKTTVGPALIA